MNHNTWGKVFKILFQGYEYDLEIFILGLGNNRGNNFLYCYVFFFFSKTRYHEKCEFTFVSEIKTIFMFYKIYLKFFYMYIYKFILFSMSLWKS